MDCSVLDVVALTRDLSDEQLVRGHVGTIVEVLGDAAFEVEFADEQGRTYAELAVKATDLMKLRYQPQSA